MGNGIWVGSMELSAGDSVTALGTPAEGCHDGARVLVRMHGAPLGHVSVPLRPADSLPARVRVAAEAKFSESLAHHQSCSRGSASNPDWLSRVICPRGFRWQEGTGLTVVICTRERPAELRECLRSVLRLSYEPLEVLVVDNAPADDGTREAVAEFAAMDSRIRYLIERKPGLSNARNSGLAAAGNDLVGFTDDDVRVDPGWASALVAGFAADPQTACVTGLVASRSLETAPERYFDSRYPWGEVFFPRRFDLAEHREPSPGYPFIAGKFGTGANFAVRRSFIGQLGEFDPMLGAGSPGKGGEDLDMFVRTILAGGRIAYLPCALVWHQHRSDYASLSEQLYGYGHGLGAYIAKRFLTREVSVAAMAAGVGRLGVLATRARRAEHDAQVTVSSGKRLALTEARGVVAGAVRYRRMARAGRRG